MTAALVVASSRSLNLSANVTFADVGLAVSLVAVAVIVSRVRRVGLEQDLLVATFRSFAQLLAIGYVLDYVFKADIVHGGYWYAAPEQDADIAIVCMGAVTPEAIAAHQSVARDFAGAGLKVCDFFELHHFRATEFMNSDCFHVVSPRAVVDCICHVAQAVSLREPVRKLTACATPD